MAVTRLALGDAGGEGLAELFLQVGLVVEEVELAGGTGHEEEDDVLGAGGGGRPGGSGEPGEGVLGEE